jgi:pimeloyl-ACP methyl ester carboxylesterase
MSMGLNRTRDEQRYWEAKLGPQRDWIWRGWPVRYSVSRPSQDHGYAPLVLIHGFGAAVEHWRHNVPVLGRDRTVYALDLLGFGGSRKASTQYTLDLWVDQLYQFWRLLIQRPIVLVGNSLGSLVCARAAQLHSEMVEAVVLINLPDVSLRQAAIPAPLRPVVNGLESLFAPPLLIKLILRVVRRPAMIRRWVAIAYPDTTAVDDELVALLSNPAYDVGAGDTLVACRNPCASPSFRHRCGR